MLMYIIKNILLHNIYTIISNITVLINSFLDIFLVSRLYFRSFPKVKFIFIFLTEKILPIRKK